MLHYLPGEMRFSDADWQAYLQVNCMFADALVKLNPGRDDIIWIQDYHLFILPQILKSRLSSCARIGFFLHTPFPSYELFQMIPVAGALLNSMLDADIVGFHSFDYARHFTDACQLILDANSNINSRSKCTITALPIGINVDQFTLVISIG